MSGPTLAKASLVEVTLGDEDRPTEETGEPVEVQFNPETLKVSYSNTVESGDNPGSAAMQFISKNSTKLTLDLLFDASYDEATSDVRSLTEDVQYFVQPQEKTENGQTSFRIPAVRFRWGSFLFEGVVASLDETLEFFSADGRPLRAKMALSINNQDIKFRIPSPSADGPSNPGRKPLAPVSAGDTVQDMAAKGGNPAAWSDIAAANGIDNPRIPTPGTFIDLGGS